MKLRKEESIPKLDKCRALFKKHLLVAQDLWGPKTTRNSVAVKPAHDSCFFISQLRGAPSREDASSQDRGSLHCRSLGDRTLQSLSNPAVQVYEL